MFAAHRRTRLPETITIDGIRIEIKDRVKVLGVTLDIKLGFSSFISSTCAKSYVSPQKENIDSKIFVIRYHKVVDSHFRYQ